MPIFEYRAVTANGRSAKGFVDADNARAARLQLRRDGYFPTELKEGASVARTQRPGERGRRMPGFLQGVSATDQAVATRQLATLLGAGVPLVGALGALSEQTENGRLKSELGLVRDRVNEGASLADALARGGLFSDLYVSMVRAGEAGGALERVLNRLADYLENQVRLKNKVSSIIIYPLFMLSFSVLVVVVLVIWVLPQITLLLEDLGQELPFYTRAIIGASDFLRGYWWALGLAGLILFFLGRAFVATERGKLVRDRILLRVPVFGRITRTVALSRFVRTLATLLSGGIPITRALDVGKDVANNRVLAEAIAQARTSVTEGASLAAPLRASGEFPPMVTQMIEVGERSGELEGMLEKVAETYDDEVETTVSRLTALLEPVLILVMVGLVLFIIMAALTPVLQLTTSVG